MGLPLRVENLRVEGDDGRALLTIDRFELEPGTCLGIRGPSGAGKSTFLYAIAGLQGRVSGAVHWGETSLLKLWRTRRDRFRAENIGLIFQDFLLFEELGAADNAALAALFRKPQDRAAIRERAEARLTDLGVPERTGTVARFSGGERQRVAIARALAADPAIILADEPTASLHRDASDAVIADLTRLAREDGRTLIVVSHDAHLLDAMDRTVTIRDGAMVHG